MSRNSSVTLLFVSIGLSFDNPSGVRREKSTLNVKKQWFRLYGPLFISMF
jgi:hypothetical protein